MSFIRERDEQRWWAASIFMVGVAFQTCELVLGNTMSPRTYGFAAYDINASTWAQGFIAGSALVLYGLLINGRWPLWSPWLRAGGWAMLSALFAYLGWSAWWAEDGLHICIFSGVFFLRRLIPFLVFNIRDAADRRASHVAE